MAECPYLFTRSAGKGIIGEARQGSERAICDQTHVQHLPARNAQQTINELEIDASGCI